jgi:hypothetical protein
MPEDLLTHLSRIDDPRSEKNRLYPLEEVLLLCICAVVSGADGWQSIADFGRNKLVWLRGYLPFVNGMPSADCLGWVMARLPQRRFPGVLHRLDALGGAALRRRGGRPRRQDVAPLA